MGKWQYILRRLLLSIIVLWGVVTITFVVARMIPSDPARMMAGPRARQEQIDRVREELGLDQPLYVQYIQYLDDMAHLDFGISFRNRQPILGQIKQLLPATLELVFLSIFLAVIIGIPLGVLSSVRRNGIFDRSVRMVTIGGVSIPPFFLALLLQILFFQYLGWFPVAGRLDQEVILYHPVQVITGFYLFDTLVTGNFIAFKSAAWHAFLPALTLAMYPIGVVTAITRTSMSETMSENYIRSARAFGLSERTIQYKLALKNAIAPSLTVLALAAAFSITGAFLVETVFVWPGIGNLAYNAIFSVDFPVIMAVTLIVTVCYILINLTVDLLQALLDPRVTLE